HSLPPSSQALAPPLESPVCPVSRFDGWLPPRGWSRRCGSRRPPPPHTPAGLPGPDRLRQGGWWRATRQEFRLLAKAVVPAAASGRGEVHRVPCPDWRRAKEAPSALGTWFVAGRAGWRSRTAMWKQGQDESPDPRPPPDSAEGPRPPRGT